MKFKLKTTNQSYTNKKLVNRYALLGFTFKESNGMYWIKGEPEIDMNTAEELVLFIKKYGDIVVTKDTIEIYNYYRE